MAKEDSQTASSAATERRDVIANFYGPVINSNVLTVGGDVVLSDAQLLSITAQSTGRVLLCSVDLELLELSGITPDQSLGADLRAVLDRELRLLLLALPPEGCIVIPPTYYCESAVCRELLTHHLPSVESGYIRLVTEFVDLDEYFDHKKERYSKARQFAHYRDAYYTPRYTPITSLPFEKTPKHTSIGSRALDIWSGALASDASQIALPLSVTREIRNRSLDTERPAFLWENVAEHVQNINQNPTSLGAQQIRALKSRAYLAAYSLAGIAVPHGSRIITDLVIPAMAPHEYNIRAWQRIFEILGLIDALCGVSPAQLLRVKHRPEVATTIATIRSLFAKKLPADAVIGILQRRRLLRTFARAFGRN